MTAQDYEDDLLQRWFPRTGKQHKLEPLPEKDTAEISTILGRGANQPWSRIPRIYIVLRMIDAVHVIDDFINERITDFWFPFAQNSLPRGFQNAALRAAFL